MLLDPVRVAEHLHGHLGWLAAGALLHPAILLRHKKRKAHLSVALSTLFVTAVGALGVWLYTPYRDNIKQGIFIDAPSVGMLFERKEHLAFAAILLSWAGAAAYAAAMGASEEARGPLRTLSHRAYMVAAALAVVTAGLGTAVASFRSF